MKTCRKIQYKLALSVCSVFYSSRALYSISIRMTAVLLTIHCVFMHTLKHGLAWPGPIGLAWPQNYEGVPYNLKFIRNKLLENASQGFVCISLFFI